MKPGDKHEEEDTTRTTHGKVCGRTIELDEQTISGLNQGT
jgi:hypothetical protein